MELVKAEATRVTHGAVLCDWRPSPFSSLAIMSHVSLWRTENRRESQVIFRAELFPIWVAKATWRDLLRYRQVIWFVDNEAARAAMVRSYSPLLDSMEMIRIARMRM